MATEHTDGGDWILRSFVDRIGAALVAPRRALVAADAEQAAGKTGSDVALLILISVVAINTRAVVAALWLAVVDGVRIALSALMGTLTAALTTDLVFLFGAGVVVTVLAGKRRSLGRDFDLACVAFVPFVAVKLLAALLFGLAGWRLGGTPRQAVTVLAYGWGAFVVLLALLHARSRPLPAGADHG